jgi:uncharacterized OB-fold protein
MEEVLEKRYLKIYCPEHFTTFEIEESPKVICEHRGHALSNNFPHEEFWEYCCDCQTFFPSQLAVGGKARGACAQCERPTLRRFVCGECKVVTFDSGEDTKGKKVHLDAETFAVEPSCPGCRTDFASRNLHLHKCDEIEAVLSTPRESCPFCKKETGKKKSKPKIEAPPVAECPKCHINNEADSFYCNNCGEELQANPQLVKRGSATAKTQLLGSICPNCGATNQPGSTFCVGCGQALKVEKQKTKTTGSLPPPIPTTTTTGSTSTWGTNSATTVNPSPAKPSSGKGCLIAVGAVVGSILLCVIFQGITKRNPSESSSYATPSPTGSYPTPGYSPSPNSTSSASLPNYFQKNYQGTIGGRSFSMSLTRSGSDLKGTAATSRSDTIEGTIDSEGSFTLKGYENGTRLTGNYNGRIYTDGTIRGTWTNLQGAQGTSFSLSEQ